MSKNRLYNMCVVVRAMAQVPYFASVPFRAAFRFRRTGAQGTKCPLACGVVKIEGEEWVAV